MGEGIVEGRDNNLRLPEWDQFVRENLRVTTKLRTTVEFNDTEHTAGNMGTYLHLPEECERAEFFITMKPQKIDGRIVRFLDVSFFEETVTRPNLRFLNLRVELTEADNLNDRIVRVDLLALGQRCPNLEKIDIIGNAINRLRVDSNNESKCFMELRCFTLMDTDLDELDLSFLRETPVNGVLIEGNNQLEEIDITPLVYCENLERRSVSLCNPTPTTTFRSTELLRFDESNPISRIDPFFDYLTDEDRKRIIEEFTGKRPRDGANHVDIQYKDVIKHIRLQGRHMENTPQTYEGQSEPDIRNAFLHSLNTVFPRRVTSETETRGGRPDIFVQLSDENKLVIECKKWDGQKYYREAINQLLGYRKWQDRHGVLITFCNKKNFTLILNRAHEAIKNHKNYIDDSFEKIDKHGAYVVARHQYPPDKNNDVFIHHLFFNFYIHDE